MQHRFNKYLQYNVILAKDNLPMIKSNRKVPASLKTNLPEISQLDAVHTGIEDFYRNVSDGYSFEWRSDEENGIGGKLRFSSSKYLFSDRVYMMVKEMNILNIFILSIIRPLNLLSDLL